MTFDRNNKNLWHDIHTGNWCRKLYDLKVGTHALRKPNLYLRFKTQLKKIQNKSSKEGYCMQTGNNFEKDTFNYQ